MHGVVRIAILPLLTTSFAFAQTDSLPRALEEITVTAEKKEQSLQDTPIAISVISTEQLELYGISSLTEMGEGAIPSLRVVPTASTPSNVIVAIRGNGPGDPSEITRESAVAVYLDGVYIARTQGLGLELADLERVEVLRGPQGSLFGRNAVGGAVSLISKKPSGEFGIVQTLSTGRFDEFRSITHINLPEFSGVSAKLDYLHSERDGWVDNTAPGETDYNEYDKDGGRLSINWQAHDSLVVDYSYDQSNQQTAQNYYQFYVDNQGVFGEERERASETRLPVQLDPTISDIKGHSLTISWQPSDNLTVKSISAYRELDEDTKTNYAGVLYYNGLNDASVMNQDQTTQEFQFIGTHDRVDWVAGIYYLQEDVSKISQTSFTLDIFNLLGGGPLSQISPPTTFDAFTGAVLPPKIVNAEARSQAAYAQATWNPEVLDDKLYLTLGGRYTEDQRYATRFDTALSVSDQDSSHVGNTVTANYRWEENISTYVKWSSAYKAGGVNTRSTSFSAFDEEVTETVEIGLKSEFWDRRARLNMAVFYTDHEDLQLDFTDSVNPLIVETINVENTAEVDGIEIDLTVSVSSALLVGMSYTYLDANMPLQPDPLDPGSLTEFFIPYTPKNAGAITLDYRFESWHYGDLTAHLDITSTDAYSYIPYGEQRTDAYSLLNARLTLAEINMGQNNGSLKASIWGENLTDEEYVVFAFAVADPAVSIAQSFGDPRSFGVDVTYEF